jgi:hypothetical protein
MGLWSCRVKPNRAAFAAKIIYPEDVVWGVVRSTGCRQSLPDIMERTHAVSADDLSQRG